MLVIDVDWDVPEECHECPFQLKFKDGVADDWYMRRCVIEQRKIEYPRPEWCPLKTVLEAKEEIDACIEKSRGLIPGGVRLHVGSDQ